MSDHRDRPPLEHAEHAGTEAFDREIDLRAIGWSTVGLVATTVAACLLMAWLFVGLRDRAAAADPPPSPIREARERRLPPGPRLQDRPEQDMAETRKFEDRLLRRPEWIDRRQGTVRIPIELAIDVIARRGLPSTGAGLPAAPAEAPAPQGAPTPMERREP